MILPRKSNGHVDLMAVLGHLAGSSEDGVEIRRIDTPDDSAAPGHPAYRWGLESGPVLEMWIDGVLNSTTAPWELDLRHECLHNARGKVLVAGLGLGTMIFNVLPRVDRLVVVENDSRVSSLLHSTLRRYRECSEKITLVERNIFQYKPDYNQRFDGIYFDIWPGDVLGGPDAQADMGILHRQFRAFKHDADSFMSSFMYRELKKQERRK